MGPDPNPQVHAPKPPTEANDIRTWAEDMASAIAKGWLLVDGESSEAGR